MADVEVRLAGVADVVTLAREMREMDRREMAAMSMRPDTAVSRARQLLDLVQGSAGRARVCYIDGKLLCIAGVLRRTALSDEGFPWLLGTDLMADPVASKIFARHCREEFLRAIPPHVLRLSNFTAAENEIALRWLRWLGFSLDAEQIEFNGMRWVRFEMVGEYVD